MRAFSFHDALDRHPEVNATRVNVRDLTEHFRVSKSAAALLRRMGPFKARTDAFHFENDFAINADQAVDFVDVISDEIVESIVNRVVDSYLGELRGIDLNPIPLLETRIPDVVMDFVAGRLHRELTARIIDLFADPVGSNFGRCGGMAFAGYDFYLAGVPIDHTVTAPPAEGALGQFIYDWLLDSLRLNVGTFTEWLVELHLRSRLNEVARTALAAAVGNVIAGPIGAAITAYLAATTDIFAFPSGKETLLESSKREWTVLKDILDRQAAWPLGLIYGDKPLLWDQHQVLAVGYTDNGAAGGTIVIWDNEDANVQSTLTLDFRGGELRTGGRRSNIKGFFHERYMPERPPASLRP